MKQYLLLLTALFALATTAFAQGTGYISGHKYVDLGLSVKWATANVGANSPSDYGNYYAWGETRTKPSYTEENCKTNGKSLGNIAGKASYDVARASWGGTWRLPLASEIEELINRCSYTWTMMGGHCGYKITGPNGNSIFLPAAGSYEGKTLKAREKCGLYWSASPLTVEDLGIYSNSSSAESGGAIYLIFYSGHFMKFVLPNYFGCSVRPVSE